MRSRWKRWVGVGLLILLFNGLLVVLSREVVLTSFVRLEENQTRQFAAHAISAYEDRLAFLVRMARDWAVWDDAYDFMRTRDPGFVASNLIDDTFSTLDVNVILFLDTQSRVAAGKAYDLTKRVEIPLPRGLLQVVAGEGALKEKALRGQGFKGLVKLAEGSMMLAWEPILDGSETGPSRGALVMGRLFDESELRQLAERANMPLEFTSLKTGPNWPAWPPADGDEPQLQLRIAGENRLRVRFQLRDIFGVPAVMLGANFSRDIYRQGLHAIFNFHVWMLFASLLGGGGILVVSERLRGSRQRQRDSEHLFQHLFEFSADASFLCDDQGRLVDVNRQACRVLGYTRQELLGMRWGDISRVSLDGPAGKSRVLEKIPSPSLEAEFRCQDGRSFPGEISVSRVELEGQVLILVLVRDISERKASDKILREQKSRLNYLAYHDVLTGLPNRLKAIELLQLFIARAKQRDSTVAVLLFDIDRFKNINESLGHEIGDEILIEIGRRIKSVLRDSDEVARFGGDEFLVLMETSPEGEGGAAMVVAEKILETVALPLHVNEQQLYLTGSVGISQFPKHGRDVQAVLKAADSAMHFAKEQGRNTFRFFVPHLNIDVKERLYLERDLRQALKEEQFMLFFQPEFDLSTGAVQGLEVLLRWQHPQRGVVAPGEFIPLAEDTGLVVPIGEWVLRESCRQLMEWRRQGLPPVRVAVNISARQFRQSGFIEMVFRILKETGLEAEWLELEFTERVVIHSAEHARNMLKVLRKSGIALAVDDFGLGYSSLIYLKNFPFTKLKMDRAFVKNITNDARDEAIAAAIVAMGTTLGLEVVAEGVEAKEQLNALRRLGCPSGQGYYLTLPMNAASTRRFLTRTLGDEAVPVRVFRD